MTLRIAAAMVVAACSGGSGQPDARVGGDDDGSFAPPPCRVTPGRTFTMTEIRFFGSGAGFDLDGDGDIDNALGFLAPIINQVIRTTIASGFSRYLFNVERWDNAPADDADVAMVAYFGVDADQPADLTNDFGGHGEFYAIGRDFDVECNPLNALPSGTVTGRRFETESDRLGLFVRNVGTVELVDIRVRFQMSVDLSTADAELGGVMTSCGLSRSYLPQVDATTLLDVALSDDRQADIDVDGDGLETIGYAAGRVTGCVDGDGTLIEGALCMCDPRITDGYSFAALAHGVSCSILGVVDTQ